MAVKFKPFRSPDQTCFGRNHTSKSIRRLAGNAHSDHRLRYHRRLALPIATACLPTALLSSEDRSMTILFRRGDLPFVLRRHVSWTCSLISLYGLLADSTTIAQHLIVGRHSA